MAGLDIMAQAFGRIGKNPEANLKKYRTIVLESYAKHKEWRRAVDDLVAMCGVNELKELAGDAIALAAKEFLREVTCEKWDDGAVDQHQDAPMGQRPFVDGAVTEKAERPAGEDYSQLVSHETRGLLSSPASPPFDNAIRVNGPLYQGWRHPIVTAGKPKPVVRPSTITARNVSQAYARFGKMKFAHIQFRGLPWYEATLEDWRDGVPKKMEDARFVSYIVKHTAKVVDPRKKVGDVVTDKLYEAAKRYAEKTAPRRKAA